MPPLREPRLPGVAAALGMCGPDAGCAEEERRATVSARNGVGLRSLSRGTTARSQHFSRTRPFGISLALSPADDLHQERRGQGEGDVP